MRRRELYMSHKYCIYYTHAHAYYNGGKQGVISAKHLANTQVEPRAQHIYITYAV